MIDRVRALYRAATRRLAALRADRHVARADRFRAVAAWPQAAQHYRAALNLAPERRPIWVQLGHALKEAGHQGPAFDAYARAAALPGSDGDAPFQLGVLARDLGRSSAAEAAFVQCLRENRGHPHARRELGAAIGQPFDPEFYLATYRDVAQSGEDPLVHYVCHGRAEGRSANMSTGRTLSTVRHIVAKAWEDDASGDVAILVTRAIAGRLQAHALEFATALRAARVRVVLVVMVDRPLDLAPAQRDAVDALIVREPGASDLAGWALALRVEPGLIGAARVILASDRMALTADPAELAAMLDRARRSPAQIVTLIAPADPAWCSDTVFAVLSHKVFGAWPAQHLVRDIVLDGSAPDAANADFAAFTALVCAGDFGTEALYPRDADRTSAQTVWQDLAAQGCPLSGVDAAALVHSRDAEAYPLLADARAGKRIVPGRRLRVALFGPWNYENGLGRASRDLLATLRRLDLAINAYPLERPFHVHRLICPPVAVTDFEGQADVAIVHLNPDSWELLTAAQRAVIASAKARVGYWVWETESVPDAWNAEFGSVDRIWAPSRYCAAVMAAAAEVPVDVVPHTVAVPGLALPDRDAVLSRFGIDRPARVILYIFDAASYLVRKNPEALIRAFARTGLAARGWVLVLKTKHVHDRPEAGQAFMTLALATPGVRVIDGSLAADEVTGLMAAADIYASPHCSEGFGLTVAEAMALGKPVVATDYGGTTDFLDHANGYPVSAEPWTLPETHGHYQAGHRWARIDENALAAALAEAAAAVERGDSARGNAARETIRRALSDAAVGAAITASFQALIAGEGADDRVRTPGHATLPLPDPPLIVLAQDCPVRFGALAPDRSVVPVPLCDDASWPLGAIPPGAADDWLLFAPAEALIHPHAVELLLASAARRLDAVLLYADDAAREGPELDQVRLKPDFDRTLLLAQDYIGAPIAVRRTVFDAVGGLRRAAGSAVLYDLVLRVAAAGGVITRIPQVMIVHPGHRPIPATADRRAALIANREVCDDDVLPGRTRGLLQRRHRFAPGSHPSVTLVIPTCRALNAVGDRACIETLLEGIAACDWPMDRLTVVVGDDIAGPPDWAAPQHWPFVLRRIETPRPDGARFNYAAKMNRLWRACDDDLVVFINDDVAPLAPHWLTALCTFAIDERVGGVGARLLYPDGTVQHAGMVPAMRTIVHAWLGQPADQPTYGDWAIAQREWSVVTGAVFATRRTVLDRVNGFDERFSLEFNDVDLCLRIRNHGWRIVYNPDAELIHAEKASRSVSAPPGEEIALFLTRWGGWLQQDPASHPGLDRNRFDCVPVDTGAAWYSAGHAPSS